MTRPAPRTIEFHYFAWVRERMGRDGETLAVPAHVGTVSELLDWLPSLGPEYRNAFADPRSVRAAMDKVHVKHEAGIAGAREIAFFPPVTGG